MDNLAKHKINKATGNKLKFNQSENKTKRFDKNKKVGNLLNES
jgi:hypothetical protein